MVRTPDADLGLHLPAEQPLPPADQLVDPARRLPLRSRARRRLQAEVRQGGLMSYPAMQTYWLEPTDRVVLGLRRYIRRADGGGFTCEDGFHSALVRIGEAPATFRDEEHGRVLAAREPTPIDDPRWPTQCACGYQFTNDDHRQADWQELLYRRSDTGEETTLRDAPPGASWDAWWMPSGGTFGRGRGADGIFLIVRCPNGRDWHVDGRASNCGLPDDVTHRCWVRHGDPRQANVTVDKNGATCSAGAGSIQAGDYHGFLQNGVLTAG
jgi:hypothetical protein